MVINELGKPLVHLIYSIYNTKIIKLSNSSELSLHISRRVWQDTHGRVGMAGMVYLSKHSKSLFRDTERPFGDTEPPFGDTERTFGDTERRFISSTNGRPYW